jgi:hypothetical protein
MSTVREDCQGAHFLNESDDVGIVISVGFQTRQDLFQSIEKFCAVVAQPLDSLLTPCEVPVQHMSEPSLKRKDSLFASLALAVTVLAVSVIFGAFVAARTAGAFGPQLPASITSMTCAGASRDLEGPCNGSGVWE